MFRVEYNGKPIDRAKTVIAVCCSLAPSAAAATGAQVDRLIHGYALFFLCTVAVFIGREMLHVLRRIEALQIAKERTHDPTLTRDQREEIRRLLT